MLIAGCGQTLVDLLTNRLTEAGQIGDFTVSLMAPRDIKKDLQNQVAVILYRIDVDPTRRHVRLTRTAPSAPARTALGLDLHYLLAVWGKGSAAGEQVTLGHCMEILDRYSVISGPLLSSAFTWDAADSLKVCFDTVSVEDMWRLWDGIDASYQLSVPYLVRTALLTPLESMDARMADTRTLVFAGGVPA
jgi:hypothetical protein